MFSLSAYKILVPKVGLRKAFTRSHILSEFQLCPSSGFGTISEAITFPGKNHSCFMFFCVSIRNHMIQDPQNWHILRFY